MEIKMTQEIDAPIDLVLRAKDERFDHADKIEGFKKIEFDETEESGNQVKTKRDFEINMDKTPAPIRKMVPAEMFRFTEIAIWDKDENKQTWEMISKAPKKLTWKGSTKYTSKGDKTEREISCTIKVKVPFIGDAIEKTMGSGFKKSMEKELRSIEAMIGLIRDGKV